MVISNPEETDKNVIDVKIFNCLRVKLKSVKCYFFGNI